MNSENQALHLHAMDNVAVARSHLYQGMEIFVSPVSGKEQHPQISGLLIRNDIPPGHKIALAQLERGSLIRRYGEVIGTASDVILAGEHIHTHNLALDFQPEVDIMDIQAQPLTPVTESNLRTFLGFARPGGKAGTRNYIAVISNVNCSAFVCQQIACYFTPERLSRHPNINGVFPMTQSAGCASTDYSPLKRTLIGMARNPNIGGYLMVGLGCETNRLSDLIRETEMNDPELAIHPLSHPGLLIQELGGTEKTIDAGIEAVEELLPRVNAIERTPQPVSKLTLALECGGSDSWSGITANPLVGFVADEIVKYGGTVVLSETPEVYGAQHLLVHRAISPDIGEKLLAKIDWWKSYLQSRGGGFSNNPSPGNIEGGITNICEKSLGAITKSGNSPLMDVYDYAASIQKHGFVFMDTPGYDPVSVTGMVAGGCNLVLFTTGRGSAAGFKPVPVIKICTNTQTFQRMIGDMDFNAGEIIDGNSDFPSSTEKLFELVIDVASGFKTKSENLGTGIPEFVPWNPYGVV